MFKNKSKEKSNNSVASAPAAPSGSTNSIVTGTSVEGTIIANNDIRIDGSLSGVLNCKGRVIIGPEGSVDGEIKCQNAVIEGKFVRQSRHSIPKNNYFFDLRIIHFPK